jgi:hypothetical protein
MKTNWLIAAAVLSAMTTAAAAAQDRSPRGASTPAARGSGTTVTVVGCVARADLSYANGIKGVGSRAVAQGGSADKFVLMNALGGPQYILDG